MQRKSGNHSLRILLRKVGFGIKEATGLIDFTAERKAAKRSLISHDHVLIH